MYESADPSIFYHPKMFVNYTRLSLSPEKEIFTVRCLNSDFIIILSTNSLLLVSINIEASFTEYSDSAWCSLLFYRIQSSVWRLFSIDNCTALNLVDVNNTEKSHILSRFLSFCKIILNRY